MLVFRALYVPLGALFWHAPVLVAWHSIKLTQALFFSGMACWRNKWAFLVYGLTWAAVFLHRFLRRDADFGRMSRKPSSIRCRCR